MVSYTCNDFDTVFSQRMLILSFLSADELVVILWRLLKLKEPVIRVDTEMQILMQ